MQDHLAEQVEFLELSASSFDSGQESEAKRLAVTIRTLVHDTESSTSLLQQLGLKSHMPFANSGQPEPAANAPHGTVMIGAGLCYMNMDLGTKLVRYAPFLGELPEDRRHPPLCFDDWWLWPVFTDMAGNAFNRKKLVLSMANKDGGAHVDSKLPNDYRALAYENSAGFGQSISSEGVLGVSFPFSLDGGPLPAPGEISGDPIENSLVLASVRQIAWELLTSIERAVEGSGADYSLRLCICPIPLKQGVTVGRSSLCPCGSGRITRDCYLAKRFPLKAVLPKVDDMSRSDGEADGKSR